MSHFVLKKTGNHNVILYLDDPSKDEFEKICKAKKIKLFNLPTFAIVYHDDNCTQTLYGIIQNKVFSEQLPYNTEIDFIKSFCIFIKNRKG